MVTKSEKVDKIIYGSVPLAMGAAVIPVPVADVVVISGVQVSMVVSITSVYGRPINKSTLRGLLFVAGGAYVGQWLWSLVKTIPGIGTIGGAIGQMLIAGTVTAAIGLAFKSLCEKGIEFSKENFKQEFDKRKKEASQVALRFKDKANQLKKLQKKVGFSALPREFQKEVTFNFNLDGYNKVSLRVTDLEGKEMLKRIIENNKTSYRWRPQNIDNGKYLAYLDIDDNIPLGIKLEKVKP